VVSTHRDALLIAGVVVALVALLFFDLSWIGLMVLALLVGGYELLGFRLAESASPSPSASS
jgi:hypothetical protein